MRRDDKGKLPPDAGWFEDLAEEKPRGSGAAVIAIVMAAVLCIPVIIWVMLQ